MMPEWYTYMQQMQQYIAYQSQQISKLESSVKLLRELVEDFRERPTTNIERVEYKFDQLKIETLEGTLNIGLNPSDMENIGDYSVPPASPPGFDPKKKMNQQTASVKEIERQIVDYLNTHGEELIDNQVKKQKIQLPQDYQDFILDDIHKQIPQRITYHMNKIPNEQLQNLDSREKTEEHILLTIQSEIQNGIELFLKNLPKEIKENSND